MLGCWITLFGLSVCWLATADADNAGVVWVLGWPAWAAARLAVQHQAWLDTLRRYRSCYWFGKVKVFPENILRSAFLTGRTYVKGWAVRDRVEGETRSPLQGDVLTGVGGQGEREGGYWWETVSEMQWCKQSKKLGDTIKEGQGGVRPLVYTEKGANK